MRLLAGEPITTEWGVVAGLAPLTDKAIKSEVFLELSLWDGWVQAPGVRLEADVGGLNGALGKQEVSKQESKTFT